MRAFKKALMAFAAVTAVSAAFAATSFAADLAASYNAGKVTVTAGLEDVSGQMTVLLIEKGADSDGITEDEILYINQAAANGNATFGEMGVLGGELADGEYTLKVGSDAEGFTLLSVDFKVSSTPAGREIQLGDCDGIAGVDIRDASAIVNNIIGVSTLTGDYAIAADCDGITGIDIRDASAVVNHIIGVATLGTVTVTD